MCLQSPVFYQFGYQVNDQDKYFGHNYQGHMEHVDGHTTTGLSLFATKIKTKTKQKLKAKYCIVL